MPTSKVDADQVVAAGYDAARCLIAELPPELHTLGLSWYPLAHARITLWSDESGYSEEQIAAVLANMNINRSWTAGRTMAQKAIYNGIVGGMTPSKRMVSAILALPRTASHADVLPYLTNGSKTNNFYWALLDIAGCPVDRWMFDIWRLPQNERWYPIVEQGITQLARHLGVDVRYAQSLAWIARVHKRGVRMDMYMP